VPTLARLLLTTACACSGGLGPASQARQRILLTGTPLQNDLGELMALLQFTSPALLGNDSSELLAAFGVGTPAARSAEDALVASQRVARAKRIMAPFVLRRKKSQVRTGSIEWIRAGAILKVLCVGGFVSSASQVMNQLPPKTDEVRRCAMSKRQRSIYTSILQASREQIGTAI